MLFKYTAKKLSEMLQSGEVSSREIVRSLIWRAGEVGGGINAYVTETFDSALKMADEADGLRASGGSAAPLCGIPVAFKDNICVKDVRSAAGTKMMADFVPPYDSFVSEKAKGAKMPVMGKTNCDEFAMGTYGELSHFGNTANPHCPERFPHGSVGGSAAAVSSGMVPVAVGGDTNGGVRVPAAYCGIVGFKPGFDMISRRGAYGFASSMDHLGVFGRSVKDAALLYDALRGYDPMNSTSWGGDYGEPCAGRLNGDIRGKRFGLPKEYINGEISEPVAAAVMKAADELRRAGADVTEISLPHTRFLNDAFLILSSGEASSNLAKFDGVRFGYRAKDAQSLDDLYVKSRTETFSWEAKMLVMTGTMTLSTGYYEEYYENALKMRRVLCGEFDTAMKDLDFLLAPVTGSVGGRAVKNTGDGEFCALLANMAGVPAVSIPGGFDGEGVPVGLQIIGKKLSEADVLNAAFGYERISGISNVLAMTGGAK